MKAIYGSTIVLGILSIAAISCNHNDDRSHAKEPRVAHDPSPAEQRRIDERHDERRADDRGDGRVIGGVPGEPSSAVGKIASARCDREVRCNNVGAKEKYSSRGDCVTRMQDDKRDDINEKDCPRGIDQKQLTACFTAIRDEACGNPLDTISRLTACRAGGICLK
jgi:Family of unknown function (DUF6184)